MADAKQHKPRPLKHDATERKGPTRPDLLGEKLRPNHEPPELVMERLAEHRQILAQDVESLRMWWPAYMHNVTLLKLDDPASYLRSKLTIPEADLAGKKTDSDNTLSARHRLALEYCRTLGVEGDAVDRLYHRIVSGDITDKRAVETDADDAFPQLDAALAEARAQWKAGGAVIKSQTVHKRIEQQTEIESEGGVLLPQTKPKSSGSWHDADAFPPSEYPAGPLTGTKKQLAKWIMDDHDPRNLDTKLDNGIYWGREDKRRKSSIWFRTPKSFAEADAKRLTDLS